MREREPTVLVPIDVSTAERPDPELLALFRTVEVVLVGWYPVPDQTAPGQLQAEKEEEAVERVESVAAEYPDDGATVETLVVFTHDRATTIDRVAEEYGCDVVVVPDDVATVERVLVPLRGDVNVDRILTVVGAALRESDVSVTLFHARPEDEAPGVGERLLDGAMEELVEAGIDATRLETQSVQTDSPVDGIVDAAAEHDVVVIGETEPSLVEDVLGDVPSRIVERAGRPVLIVRDAG